jgi:5-methylcytosine-specific restriction endonuclease McrA
MKKICTICKENLPIGLFGKNNNVACGYKSACKKCRRVEQQAAYYADVEKTRKNSRISTKKFRTKNPEKCKESIKKWKEKNTEYFKNYRLKNAEKRRADKKAWKIKNKEAVCAQEHRRRALKAEVGGNHTAKDIKSIFTLQKGKCPVCAVRLKNYHIDHVYPLCLGGSNAASNLQLLCQNCNLKKSKKHPIDFMRENGFLL